MKNILLLTDFSKNSWNAIKYAIPLFENETCDFYLLYVERLNNTMVIDHAYGNDHNVITEDVHTKTIMQQLTKVIKQIKTSFPSNKNHKYYSLYDYNIFIESIRRHVEEKKIDIIVMGTKGASGSSQSIIGCNTNDVITKVKCTTLAVPENTQFVQPKEIAFPTDFSLNYNMRMLEPLSYILEKYKPTLRILNISKNKTDLNIEQKRNRALLDDYFSYVNHSFHYLTNTYIEKAMQFFIESRNVNIICMVAKNLNYFQQILFHSRIEGISYHTGIPFLILHEKN